MRFKRGAWLAAIFGGLCACDSVPERNLPACIPAEEYPCFCHTGEHGTKKCSTDGLGFELCACVTVADAATADTATADDPGEIAP